MSGNRERILVIDDDRAVRDLVCEVLGDEGFLAEPAADSAAALRRIAEWRPDLILLDLRMPGVDGWGLLEHLHARGEGVPVVILSGGFDPNAAARSVRAGASAFLSKPIHFGALTAACRRLLDHRPSVPPEAPRERRGARRLPLIAAVTVAPRPGDSGAEDRAPVVGDLVDLSPTGAQLVLPTALQSGTRVRLSLEPRALGRPVRLTAEVRWRRVVPTGHAHGLVFTEALPSLDRLLDDTDPD